MQTRKPASAQVCHADTLMADYRPTPMSDRAATKESRADGGKMLTVAGCGIKLLSATDEGEESYNGKKLEDIYATIKTRFEQEYEAFTECAGDF